jgi:hypothetical protein
MPPDPFVSFVLFCGYLPQSPVSKLLFEVEQKSATDWTVAARGSIFGYEALLSCVAGDFGQCSSPYDGHSD